MFDHWFWLLVSIACIGWYLIITGYIAWKGIYDIGNMLRRLKEGESA